MMAKQNMSVFRLEMPNPNRLSAATISALFGFDLAT